MPNQYKSHTPRWTKKYINKGSLLLSLSPSHSPTVNNTFPSGFIILRREKDRYTLINGCKNLYHVSITMISLYHLCFGLLFSLCFFVCVFFIMILLVHKILTSDHFLIVFFMLLSLFIVFNDSFSCKCCDSC